VNALLVEQGARPSTAFERTLLPDFARWFLARVEAVGPDYLIPAETKGARLLDVVLDHLREELGVQLEIPVLYRPALAYLDPDELRRSRVLVLDDARRTGTNFNLHVRRLVEFGATNVHAAICVCLDPEEESDPEESFILTQDPALYEEYVQEMTELVVAPGLPPEVDHLVFELETPGPLAIEWSRIEAALAPYGDLALDAPQEDWGLLRPLTLHNPALPGTTDFPTEGCVRNDGPRKIRAFPDAHTGRTMIVPVAFPTLELPPEAAGGLDLVTAERFLEEWTGKPEGIACVLLRDAGRRDPETLFRALSVFAELDLMLGLARVLSGALVEGPIGVRVERRLLDRLFGAKVGPKVAAEIEARIARALEEPVRPAEPIIRPDIAIFVDRSVVVACDRIVEDLRGLYEKRREALGHEPEERVGRSLAAISTALEIKRLLTSRCIDYGLALTTLVPYVDVDRREDGSFRVERKYRVSENGGRGVEESADREVDNLRVAQEVLAYSSMHLRRRAKDRYGGDPLPAAVVTGVLAVMAPMLRGLNIRISTRTAIEGLRVAVRRGERWETLGDSDCLAYTVVDLSEGTSDAPKPVIEPTPRFLERDSAGETMIDRRRVTWQVEGFIDAMRPLFESDVDDDTLSRLLDGATMSSAGPLGLSVVQTLIETALEEIESTLIKLTVRPEGEIDLSPDAEDALKEAGVRLERLSTDWFAPAATKFEDPTKIEGDLRRWMGVPEEDLGPIYEIPRAVLAASDSLRLLASRLIEASDRLERTGTDPGELPSRIFSSAHTLAASLVSLGPPRSRPAPKGQAREQITAAAESLLGSLDVLRSFAAATAVEYRGPRRGEPMPVPEEPDRFKTILFPDLAGSKMHSRTHSFDSDYAWKSRGLGLFAQWGRAFGGIETRKREGDCLWHEFEEPGDPAVLGAAVIRVHAAALEALGVPRLRWPVHLAVHFGRVKDDAGDNTIGQTVDELNELCRLGEARAGNERVSVTQEVIDSCSPELREPSLTSPIQGIHDELSPKVKGLWSVDAAAAVELLAGHIEQVASGVLADIPEDTGLGDDTGVRRAAVAVEDADAADASG
jgi:hypothetical protein